MSDPTGPFAPYTIIGGNGGSPFTEVGWKQGTSALAVTSLTLWFNTNNFKGIQLTYSDSTTSVVYGSPIESQATIVFQPGEYVTSMILWGNGVGTEPGTRTGRIRLITNLGQTFDHGKDTGRQTAYTVDVGSGILVGMLGRSGLDIDNLGAIFLKPKLKHILITDIHYDPELPGTRLGISEIAIKKHQYSNPENAKSDQTFNFTGSTSRPMSTSYSQTAGVAFGSSVPVDVSARVFSVATTTGATGDFRWFGSQGEQTRSTTVTSTLPIDWSKSITLAPGKSTDVTAVVNEGDTNIAYRSIVQITLEDGSKNQYSESGRFHIVADSDVFFNVKNTDK